VALQLEKKDDEKPIMSPEDLKAFIESLPLKKKATTVQILMLLAAIGFIFGAGIWAGNWAKNYFDDSHHEIMAAINRVDTDNSGKIAVVAESLDKASSNIDSLRHYYWSNADMQRWASDLDHLNRLPVPAMIVPQVPQPVPGTH
jgi:hypothetical protein